jgi:hypothetical protein
MEEPIVVTDSGELYWVNAVANGGLAGLLALMYYMLRRNGNGKNKDKYVDREEFNDFKREIREDLRDIKNSISDLRRRDS